MAYSTGGFQQHHQDEAPDPTHIAQNGGGGAPEFLETQDRGADAPNPDLATRDGPGPLDFAGGGSPLSGGAKGGAYGPGDNDDGHGGSGFMPNGEDGLMVLADYAAAGGSPMGGAPANDGPGGGAAGESFGMGSGDFPGAPTAQIAGNGDGGLSGFGFPGGGSGGFGGGGGGGGGFGGGNPPDGGPTNPFTPTTPSGGDSGGCVLNCIPTGGGPTPPTFIPSPPAAPPIPPAGNPPVVTPPVVVPPVGGPPSGAPPGPPVEGPRGHDNPQPPSVGPIPEPATWLSMIVGFGVLGAALRRRRAVA